MGVPIRVIVLQNLQQLTGTLDAKAIEWSVTELGRYRKIPLYANEATYEDFDETTKPWHVSNVARAGVEPRRL
jgi:hypothetical protein